MLITTAAVLLTGCPKATQPEAAQAPPHAQQASSDAATKVELTTTTFKVEGMDCKECSTAIESELIKIKGVSTVSADERNGTAKVQYDPAAVTTDKLIAAIDSLKFKATVQN
jgi:copper chaperone CopZ